MDGVNRLRAKIHKSVSDEEINVEFDNGYRKGGSCDVTHLYSDKVFEIADERECIPMDVTLLEHDTEGEICIYIKGKWCGYLDSVYSY